MPVQSERLLGDQLLLPLLFSASILLLGVVATSLRRGAFRDLFHLPIAGNIIIVFVMFCVPIGWVASVALRESGDIYVLVASVVPIFSAGLALEEYAMRFVEQAKRSASQNPAEQPPDPTKTQPSATRKQ